MTKETLEGILGENRVTVGKDISPYFTLKTQTSAEFYFEAESREDWEKVGKLKAEGNSIFILGGGSNLAITKDLIPGLVVRNIYEKKEIISETDTYMDLLVSSGYPVARLTIETVNEGWSGLEYQLGLPGTVGGAIYMNSKWTKPISYFGDALLYAFVIGENGMVKREDRDYFQFAYDYSILQKTGEMVVEAVFRFQKTNSEVLKKAAFDALAYRKQTQPQGVSTGGCFFRNISEEEKNKHNLPTTSAGYLIDNAGLKGKQIGDFIVSDKHANFIINLGNGKPADLSSLLQEIKNVVKEKYNLDLQEEVIVI